MWGHNNLSHLLGESRGKTLLKVHGKLRVVISKDNHVIFAVGIR